MKFLIYGTLFTQQWVAIARGIGEYWERGMKQREIGRESRNRVTSKNKKFKDQLV